MGMPEEQKQETYEEFNDLVNLQPQELEDWLQTDESRDVGDADEGEESTGHRSGRKIVQIKRTYKQYLSRDQYEHMQKVCAYIKRHLAQRPKGSVTETAWRYALMNWGHDPEKSS